jgi:hypothetical protein
LYAYNYDRVGDSAQAKANLEKYFANPTSKVKPDDYELAVKVFSKFPGSEGNCGMLTWKKLSRMILPK